MRFEAKAPRVFAIEVTAVDSGFSGTLVVDGMAIELAIVAGRDSTEDGGATARLVHRGRRRSDEHGNPSLPKPTSQAFANRITVLGQTTIN